MYHLFLRDQPDRLKLYNAYVHLDPRNEIGFSYNNKELKKLIYKPTYDDEFKKDYIDLLQRLDHLKFQIDWGLRQIQNAPAELRDETNGILVPAINQHIISKANIEERLQNIQLNRERREWEAALEAARVMESNTIYPQNTIASRSIFRDYNHPNIANILQEYISDPELLSGRSDFRTNIANIIHKYI